MIYIEGGEENMNNPITNYYNNENNENNENIVIPAKFTCGYISIMFYSSLKENNENIYKKFLVKLNVYRRLLNNKLITETCFFCLSKRTYNFSEEEIHLFKKDIFRSELKINQEKWRSAFMKSTRQHLLTKYLYNTILCQDVINEIVKFTS